MKVNLTNYQTASRRWKLIFPAPSCTCDTNRQTHRTTPSYTKGNQRPTVFPTASNFIHRCFAICLRMSGIELRAIPRMSSPQSTQLWLRSPCSSCLLGCGKKVKVKVKVKFTLQQAMKAQRESKSIAILFLSPQCYMEGVWSMPCPSRLTPWNDPVPTLRRLGGPRAGLGWCIKSCPY